jgi:hypothetical protein
MKVGWNSKYVMHCLTCLQWISRSCKLLILAGALSLLVVGFPISTGLVASGEDLYKQRLQTSVLEAGLVPLSGAADPDIQSIERLLKGYGVEETHRNRIALAIVAKSQKYDLDPRLVASVMIVESRANPFAISTREAVGVMQVHLPTWGPTVEEEGLNLFKIEDNVELGTRILKGYVARHGLWQGVMRYKGWYDNNPESHQSASEYAQKVRRIYDPSFVASTELAQTHTSIQ